MTGPLYLGNDVVDLAEIRARPRPPERLLRLEARVLSPWEREELAGTPPEERHPRFWCTWAAKETAFKVHTKALGRRPVFRHSLYRVSLDIAAANPGGGGGNEGRGGTGGGAAPGRQATPRGGAAPDQLHRVTGFVTYGEDGEAVGAGASGSDTFRVDVEGWWCEAFVHLAGHGPVVADEAPSPVLELGMERERSRVEDGDRAYRELEEDFSPREWASVHSAASARARILARQRLAAWVGVDPGDVEILTDPSAPGRSPPRVQVRGRSVPGLDLSLSHHGACIAWALLLPRRADLESLESAESAEPTGPLTAGGGR